MLVGLPIHTGAARDQLAHSHDILRVFDPNDFLNNGPNLGLADWLRSRPLDRVILVVGGSATWVPHLAQQLDQLGVPVALMPVSNRSTAKEPRGHSGNFGKGWLLAPEKNRRRTDRLKRAMDMVLASAGLLLLAPVFALLAFLIHRADGGPVFYRQTRLGRNGRLFEMIKFRTMRPDAERDTGPVFTTRDDDRRTLLGAWLRRTSLDELPQLWNVLRGEMSLVGPRPERPIFVDRLRRLPNYMLRHEVDVGITGLAQVQGLRGDTSRAQRLRYDLEYVLRRSIWLDLRILILTLIRLPFDKNAY